MTGALDILRFIFSSFWIWLWFAILLSIVVIGFASKVRDAFGKLLVLIHGSSR